MKIRDLEKYKEYLLNDVNLTSIKNNISILNVNDDNFLINIDKLINNLRVKNFTSFKNRYIISEFYRTLNEQEIENSITLNINNIEYYLFKNYVGNKSLMKKNLYVKFKYLDDIFYVAFNKNTGNFIFSEEDYISSDIKNEVSNFLLSNYYVINNYFKSNNSKIELNSIKNPFEVLEELNSVTYNLDDIIFRIGYLKYGYETKFKIRFEISNNIYYLYLDKSISHDIPSEYKNKVIIFLENNEEYIMKFFNSKGNFNIIDILK